MTTLTDLRRGYDPVYAAKQMHAIPAFPAVVREEFLLERTKGKVVLDVGASGPMHEAIVRVANRCYGIDKPSEATLQSDLLEVAASPVIGLDLDDHATPLPLFPDVEVVVCGEVLEHLSNPGQFLDKLRAAYHCTLAVTAPNAFSASGRHWVEKGTECVNAEHVAWYSWKTLDTLLRRHAWKPAEWAWYKGVPMFSEGIVVVAE